MTCPTTSSAAQQLVREDSTFLALARIRGLEVDYPTADDVSAIKRTVTHQTDTVTQDAVNVSPATAVLDEPTVDVRWGVDSTGYNFRDTVPAAAVPMPGRYRLEYLFVMADGSQFYVVFHLLAESVSAT